MLLSDRKLVFIHIPKCAGTSVEVFFAGRDWAQIDPRTKHVPARLMAEHCGRELWDACFKFSIVRNPWARLLSFFHLVRQMQPDIGFDEWIAQVCSAEGLCFRGLPVHRSMCEYLLDADGRLMVDFVGRVETLAEDFETIKQRAGVSGGKLPQVMAGRYDHDYRKWYSARTRDLVAQRFGEDIERFGYGF